LGGLINPPHFEKSRYVISFAPSELILDLPPVGYASSLPHMVHFTTEATLEKTVCSFPHSGHWTLKNLLRGMGVSISFLFISSTSHKLQLLQPLASPLVNVTAFLAFQPEAQLLGSLCCPLQFWLPRASVTLLLPLIPSRALGHGPLLTLLINGNAMSRVNPTPRAVTVYLLWSIHFSCLPLYL
jgi:hypothetical protein